MSRASSISVAIVVCFLMVSGLHAQVLSGYTPIYQFNVPDGGYDGLGNVLNYTDSANGNWTLSYDALNRLSTAAATSGPYNSLNLNFGYDSFGNRANQTVSGAPPIGTIPSRWALFDNANRMTSSDTSTAPNSIEYDGSGNMTFNGSVSVAYDDDGNVCATRSVVLGGTVTQYLYDAEGRRVAKGYSAASPTALACSDGGSDFIPTATYALGQSGEQVTELDGSGAWKHTNVYANGALIATYDTTGRGLHFYIDDPLGSRRVQVSSLGEVEQNCTNMPFGDNAQAQQPCISSGSDSFGNTYLANTTDPTEHHFTGKERDAESGLDYFGARYYGSSMGRWMSPDWADKPEAVPYSQLDDPQSLNLYGYVNNNPLSKVDVDGHDAEGFTQAWDFVAPSLEAAGVKALQIGGVLAGAALAKASGLLDKVVDSAKSVDWGHYPTSTIDGIPMNHAILNQDGAKSAPNPDGQKGAPDHQAAVQEEVDKARAAAGPGETVTQGTKIQVEGSTRRPDVQTVGVNGRTKSIVEVERRPNSQRNKNREAEYDRLGIPHTTRSLPPRNK